jgi:lipopolysaccharide transport system permease protein
MSGVRVITSNPFTIKEYWTLMRKHRSLVWVFVLQEIKAMYAQTYLGIIWSMVRPLITLLIFTIIFSFFLNVKTQSPYYLFAFVGMMAWNLFAQIATQASSAVLQKQQLIRKMFFPKMILPLAKTIVVSVEFGVALAMLFVFMIYERFVPSIQIIIFPLFLALNVVVGLAVAIWMNALTIRFRDLTLLIPTVIGIGIWVTPVFFPTTIIPEQYNLFIYLNPMAGVIKGYRYALLGEAFPESAYWWSMIVFVLLFFVGIWYFIQVEDDMVDYV